jgi:glucose-6-phosphate 1-epimerase
VRQAEKFEEESQELRITQETDRVYIRSPETTKIRHANGSYLVHKEGFDDIVVWNPWIEKAKAMSDFGDEEYKEMVCAEAGQISTPVVLAAKASWVGKLTLKSAL